MLCHDSFTDFVMFYVDVFCQRTQWHLSVVLYRNNLVILVGVAKQGAT